jgi:lysyl-tRNA synthetase class 1
MAWTEEFVPLEDRTIVRSSPDAERLASLSEDEELWLRIFLDRLPEPMDLDTVTAVVYGVPKVARGLGFEDSPTDQVKADQKDFFRLLYNLLVDKDRGPRLPTLILALGSAKVRSLLGVG